MFFLPLFEPQPCQNARTAWHLAALNRCLPSMKSPAGWSSCCLEQALPGLVVAERGPYWACDRLRRYGSQPRVFFSPGT